MKEEIKKRMRRLAVELKNLLEENLPKDPNLTDEATARARQIREEIQSMGLLATWKANLDPENPEKVKVDVTLWMPKENMTPEDQKIYDEWFARVNKIKPPK